MHCVRSRHQCIYASSQQVRYNGQSVLENHHTDTAITLMKRPELDFLCRMRPQVCHVQTYTYIYIHIHIHTYTYRRAHMPQVSHMQTCTHAAGVPHADVHTYADVHRCMHLHTRMRMVCMMCKSHVCACAWCASHMCAHVHAHGCTW